MLHHLPFSACSKFLYCTFRVLPSQSKMLMCIFMKPWLNEGGARLRVLTSLKIEFIQSVWSWNMKAKQDVMYPSLKSSFNSLFVNCIEKLFCSYAWLDRDQFSKKQKSYQPGMKIDKAMTCLLHKKHGNLQFSKRSWFSLRLLKTRKKVLASVIAGLRYVSVSGKTPR